MMTGKSTIIARPYALAAFESASAKKNVAAWETFLNNAAVLVNNKTMQCLMDNPAITQEQVVKLLSEMIAVTDEQQNFLHILAENKRLIVLPDIFQQFKTLREDQQKNIEVTITTAIPMDDAQQQKMIQALTKRLQRSVTLQCAVDSDVLGGMIVRAGDQVIDGSVRGKLTRLLACLN